MIKKVGGSVISMTGINNAKLFYHVDGLLTVRLFKLFKLVTSLFLFFSQFLPGTDCAKYGSDLFFSYRNVYKIKIFLTHRNVTVILLCGYLILDISGVGA